MSADTDAQSLVVVAQLRQQVAWNKGWPVSSVLAEAADTIERLLAERDALNDELTRVTQDAINAVTKACRDVEAERDAQVRDRDTLQRQLDAVDAVVGFPDGTGAGRIEMLKASARPDVDDLRTCRDGGQHYCANCGNGFYAELARVPAPAVSVEWQPIKSLDYGVRVLLLWPGKGPDVVAGSKHHSGDDAEPYWIFDGHWRNPAYPTHWMPLPSAALQRARAPQGEQP